MAKNKEPKLKEGDLAPDFTATTNCLILAPLVGCTVPVVFKAQAATVTPEAAILTVTDTGASGSVVSASLSGTAY